MRSNKEVITNIVKFIDANPDIERIGINKKDYKFVFEKLALFSEKNLSLKTGDIPTQFRYLGKTIYILE